MSGLNKCMFIGRLGRDPETKSTNNSGTVCNFSIAISEKWKDKNSGETKEKTEWVNLVLWNKLAEIANQYLHKGDLVYVEGKMSTRSYEKDGVTRYTTEVQVMALQMLSTKGSSEKGTQGAPAYDDRPKEKPTPSTLVVDDGMDLLPF